MIAAVIDGQKSAEGKSLQAPTETQSVYIV